MQLYNSLTRNLDNFQTSGEPISLYVCGITPYDTTHLGHAFTYTSVDILVRYLESKNNEVVYVQNVTDIDDDILRKATESGEDWRSLGNRWTAHFIQDMIDMNVRPPDFYPRATDVISEIISMVEKLLAVGVAYQKAGNVYFAVDSWPDFGKLSALERGAMLPIANERGNRPDDPYKRDPLDFVLWQSQANGEPAWDSPWGPGRPGWHIECSTMSTKYLGSPIDIHSGGADLSFPHHECEIAQIEPINGNRPFVKYWFHVAMVYHEGAKMSKSLGNLVMVRDLLRLHSTDALRLYLGSHHHRESWSHSEAELSRAQDRADLIYASSIVNGGDGPALDSEGFGQQFDQAMDDDLNTPVGVEIMIKLAEDVQTAARENKSIESARQRLNRMGRVFGLQLGTGTDARVLDGWNKHLQRFPLGLTQTD